MLKRAFVELFLKVLKLAHAIIFFWLKFSIILAKNFLNTYVNLVYFLGRTKVRTLAAKT